GRVLQDVVERVEDVLVRLDAVAPILPDQLLDPRFEGESGHRSLRAPHRRGAPRFPIGASGRPPGRKKPIPRDAGRSDLDRWGGPLPGPRRLGVARAHPSSDGSTGPSSTSTESSGAGGARGASPPAGGGGPPPGGMRAGSIRRGPRGSSRR